MWNGICIDACNFPWTLDFRFHSFKLIQPYTLNPLIRDPWPWNCKQIHSILHGSQELHYITVPVKDPATRRGRSTLRLPFLMPHELIHYLYVPKLKRWRV